MLFGEWGGGLGLGDNDEKFRRNVMFVSHSNVDKEECSNSDMLSLIRIPVASANHRCQQVKASLGNEWVLQKINAQIFELNCNANGEV